MKLKFVVLSVYSYTDLGSFNAEHWYGKLSCSDESGRKTHELKRKLTDQKEVDHLVGKDDYGWKVGDETNRFQSRKDVEDEAVRQWKAAFPGYDALVVGMTAIADPQRPLSARSPAILKTLQCFWKAVQDAGGYEKNSKAMDEIFKEYWSWMSGNSETKPKRKNAARRESPRVPVKGS